MFGRDNGYEYIRVRSPDSDIFFILLHYALQIHDVTILFDTGTGNKKRLFNITEIARRYTQGFSTALMALHAFTGCDTSSAFKGIGKIKPIKTLQKVPEYIPVFCLIGETWEVSVQLFSDLESFTCAMYGFPRFNNIDELRLFLLKKKCGNSNLLTVSNNVDIASLPPCKKSLEQHIKRVNYQVAIWKRSHIANPDIPPPTEGHGWTHHDGYLEPLWIDGDTLPLELIDILEEFDSDMSDD